MSGTRIYAILFITIALCCGLGACGHDASTDNARAVKAYVIAELSADSSGKFDQARLSLDSLPLANQSDCDDFYNALNEITYDMEFSGSSTEVTVVMRRILDILHDAPQRTIADTREMLNMYVRLGASFTDIGMSNVGLDYYMTGLKYCRDSIYDDYKAMLCNNLGILYAERKLPIKAEEYFNTALEINLRHNTHHETFINYGNLTEFYAMQGETEKALETSQRSLDYIDQRNHPDHLASMRILQGMLYTKLAQYDMALSRYDSGLQQYRELGDTRGIIGSYLHISDNYLQWGMPDSAITYALLARDLCRTHERDEDMGSTLRTLARIHETKGDIDEALELMNELTQLSDSLRNAENSVRMSNWESISSAMIPETEQPTNTANVWLLVAVIALSGLLALLVVIYLKLRREQRETFRTASESELQYNQAVDKLNRELTTLSLEKIKLHEGLTEICDGLRSVLLELNPRETAKRDNIRTQLNRLNALAEFDADEEFKLYFERVHPDFYQILNGRYPELTMRDLRLCALLYLGLTTKEIASLTYREIRSVESARNRLRKKLGLGLTDDLTAHLRSVA